MILADPHLCFQLAHTAYWYNDLLTADGLYFGSRPFQAAACRLAAVLRALHVRFHKKIIARSSSYFETIFGEMEQNVALSEIPPCNANYSKVSYANRDTTEMLYSQQLGPLFVQQCEGGQILKL